MKQHLERLRDALEERTGLPSMLHHLLNEPIRGGARFAYVFGSILASVLVIQLASGLVLASDYSASVDAAHASVSRIMDPAQVPLGWLVRALHHHGASFLVILLVAHLVQVAVFGAYRRPREGNWLTGLVLAFLILAFAFTGYLLPWDETAYYATRVGLNITASTPIAGPSLAALLQGGDVMGNLTLTRFYAVHVLLLPTLLLSVLAVHLYLFRRHGVTPRPGRSASELEVTEPFWPHQAFKDAVAILAAVAVLVAFAAWQGAPLGPKADPAAPFDARPEWYFFWLFQLLHYFEPPFDWIATMGIPGAIAAFLALLPWIDRGKDARPAARKLALGGLAVILGGMAVLTLLVVVDDRAKAREALAEGEAAGEARPGVAAAGAISPLELGMLFGQKCTECHDRSGAPNDPDAPDFRDPEFARSGRANRAKLIQAIKEGGEIMPAFEEELTDAEIRALLDQIVLRFAETNPLPPEDASPAPTETEPATQPQAPGASAPKE